MPQLTNLWDRRGYVKECMESLDILNKRLLDTYGRAPDEQPLFRIAMSDQTELQVGKFTKMTENGIYLGEFEGFQEVPKYPWIKPRKHILERRAFATGDKDLSLTTKFSYESIWVFGKGGDPLAEPIDPNWDVIQFIIQLVSNRGQHSVYKEDTSMEDKQAALDNLYDSLYGNETAVTDNLHLGQGVVVPNNYKGN